MPALPGTSLLSEFKEDWNHELTRVVRLQPLGTTLKNFVISSKSPLISIKIFLQTFFFFVRG